MDRVTLRPPTVFVKESFREAEWRRPVVYLLFFCSGVSALVYQVTWVRAFTTVFGSTVASASSMYAALNFMMIVGGVEGSMPCGSSRISSDVNCSVAQTQPACCRVSAYQLLRLGYATLGGLPWS
mgnify:CR=1 FL=1